MKQSSLSKFLDEIEVQPLNDPLCRLYSHFIIKDGDKTFDLEELIFLFKSYRGSGIYLSYDIWNKNIAFELSHERIIKLPN